MPKGYSAWGQRAGKTLAERLAFYTRPAANGCRVWGGHVHPRFGYGYLSFNGKKYRAHRAAWEVARGPIPQGLFVCHHCDNRACINIDHLFLGTAKDNTHDMMAKGRQARLIGELGANAKLSEGEAKAIIRDTRPYQEIADAYGIHPVSVYRIKRGTRWGHLQ
jgi:hypothetical protein